MKMTKILILALILAFAAACSNNKKKTDEIEGTSSVVESEDSDFIVDAEDEVEESLLVDDTDEEALEGAPQEVAAETPVIEGSGNFASYQVQKGDTLMLVAFKIYGDYSKWKELKSYNPEISSSLISGSSLKYEVPLEKFVWEPEGLPHLIVNGETLGTISNDKYGTEKRWKEIFDHNKPMIKKPNLIFAGFTLYYMPDEREIASEQ